MAKIIDKFNKEVNMYNMYGAYSDFKKLFEFYQDHKNFVGVDEIRKRIDYIKKYGVKQRTEIETLHWILGEDIVGNQE